MILFYLTICSHASIFSDFRRAYVTVQTRSLHLLQKTVRICKLGQKNLPLAEGDLEWADSVTGKPKAELLRAYCTNCSRSCLAQEIEIYVISWYRFTSPSPRKHPPRLPPGTAWYTGYSKRPSLRSVPGGFPAQRSYRHAPPGSHPPAGW